LRYHDPDNWPILRQALVHMGRSDLIGHGKQCLVPAESPRHHGPQRRGERAKSRRSG